MHGVLVHNATGKGGLPQTHPSKLWPRRPPGRHPPQATNLDVLHGPRLSSSSPRLQMLHREDLVLSFHVSLFPLNHYKRV